MNASWILQYLNENMYNQEYDFECAVVHYNKDKNIISYADANIDLYYFQDKTLHKIEVDKQAIGLDKESKYLEHSINIKDYIELYLATNEYFKNHIDTQNFTSPFLSQTNWLEKQLEKVDENIIISAFQIDNKPKVLIEYEGEFTQDGVNKCMDTIEDKVENIGLMSNISTNFVEQYQNILNYGKSKDIKNKEITPFGYIKLQKNPNETYSIESKNIISLADKEKIEPKLVEIKSLDKAGIKKRYRELRRSGENTHKKGGGVGFYEIAKRCSKIEYEFKQINEDRFEFTFISYVDANKKWGLLLLHCLKT